MDRRASRKGMIVLRSDVLEAHIDPLGAELIRLIHSKSGDLLWTPDKTLWRRTAPILFPVVGRSRNNSVRVGGLHYEMPPHGFAMLSRFEVVETNVASCELLLTDDPATRAHFPFAFSLRLEYALEGIALKVTATVANKGRAVMPVSLGFHPGFRWPLVAGIAKEDHELVFPDDDWLDCRRLVGGLLETTISRLLLEDHRLGLHEGLFDPTALIVLSHRSREVRYRGRGGGIEISVLQDGLPHLGLWMRPGGNFICIEPWHGFAEEVGFEGDLRDRPGSALLHPAELRHFSMMIEVHLPIAPGE